MTPDRPLLAFYGDDFTGSTDAAEVLTFAGVPTILFLRTPSAEDLQRFSNYRAVGVAGIARAMSPEWMQAHLPSVFTTLAALRPHIFQYKVCSTFDSSPEIGSIGQAIDVGMSVMEEPWSPVVVGAPRLRRWQMFGNLFAGTEKEGYRLDRHPTMSRHPVTPMHESDLRLHLGVQTAKRIGLVDMVDLGSDAGAHALKREKAIADIVLFDVMDERTQRNAGRTIWDNRGAGLFSASSSGLDYALVDAWRQAGTIPEKPPHFDPPASVDRLLVISGSCSPRTAEQIAAAERAGFAAHRLDVVRIANPASRAGEIERLTEAAGNTLLEGRSAIVFAARTVDDPAFAQLLAYCESSNIPFDDAQQMLGDALGTIVHGLVRRHGLKRLLVAGGDTSGRVIATLPLIALEAQHALVRGAPICRAYSDDPEFDGLEVVLKGGQIGGENLFEQCRTGLSEENLIVQDAQ